LKKNAPQVKFYLDQQGDMPKTNATQKRTLLSQKRIKKLKEPVRPQIPLFPITRVDYDIFASEKVKKENQEDGLAKLAANLQAVESEAEAEAICEEKIESKIAVEKVITIEGTIDDYLSKMNESKIEVELTMPNNLTTDVVVILDQNLSNETSQDVNKKLNIDQDKNSFYNLFS